MLFSLSVRNCDAKSIPLIGSPMIKTRLHTFSINKCISKLFFHYSVFLDDFFKKKLFEKRSLESRFGNKHGNLEVLQ